MVGHRLYEAKRCFLDAKQRFFSWSNDELIKSQGTTLSPWDVQLPVKVASRLDARFAGIGSLSSQQAEKKGVTRKNRKNRSQGRPADPEIWKQLISSSALSRPGSDMMKPEDRRPADA
jgi:hypothetical protein